MVIENTQIGISVPGTDAEDSINNIGSNVTVDAGKGDDIINNDSRGTSSILEGGRNDDKIKNDAANVTISGGAGDDSITNSGESVSIVGNSGGDSIWNTGKKTTIDSGADDDYINNRGASVTVDSGLGESRLTVGLVMTPLLFTAITRRFKVVTATITFTITAGIISWTVARVMIRF